MTPPSLDRERLQQALALVEDAFGQTEPNPRVGCIVGREDGTVLGSGITQKAGGPHAEALALRQALQQGHDLRGATVWVTLEPCAHHGRTPPCCDALIDAQVGRVVVGALDPFPAVNGAGIQRMRAAGIVVDMADDEIAAACRDVNIGFFSRMERGRPWIRLKIAASLDGKSALLNGQSQWITGAEARMDGHAWRRRASAVLTGIGTVLADNPRLDVRLVHTEAQPMRVVLDSNWRTPLSAQILALPGQTVIVGAASSNERTAALQEQGVELIWAPGSFDRVDLRSLMGWLNSRCVNELHVEAGAKLNGALLSSGLVDEVLLYLAPLLVGEGRSIVECGPIDTLAQALRLKPLDFKKLGDDLRIRLLTQPASVRP